MKGTFFTTEVINLLNLRVPGRGHRQFRLQNFLLGRADWQSSTATSLHIGEEGEIETLRRLLGKERLQRIDKVRKSYSDKVESGEKIFPTVKAYANYVRDVRRELGPRIEFNLEN